MRRRLGRCVILLLTGVVVVQLALLFVAISSLPLSARLFGDKSEYVVAMDYLTGVKVTYGDLIIFGVSVLFIMLLVDAFQDDVFWLISGKTTSQLFSSIMFVINFCVFSLMWRTFLSMGGEMFVKPLMSISESGVVISESLSTAADAHTLLKNLLARVDYLVSVHSYQVLIMALAAILGLASTLMHGWLSQIYDKIDEAAE